MLIDSLFPNFTCLACGDEINVSGSRHVCDSCFSQFKAAKPRKVPLPPAGVAYSAFFYSGPVPKLVLGLKYSNDGVVAQAFAPHMAAILEESYDLIIPVPLSKRRGRQRGYNQAALLAGELSRLMAVPAYEGMERTKDTAQQYVLDPAQRAANVAGAFAVKAGFCVEGKRVLLVDDILTTGATAIECAKILTETGAAAVEIITFARAAL